MKLNPAYEPKRTKSVLFAAKVAFKVPIRRPKEPPKSPNGLRKAIDDSLPREEDV